MFAAAAVLAGCNKTEIENGGGMGTLKFSLNPSVDDSYNEKGEGMLGGSSSQRAATKAVDNEAILNSMLVTISNNDGEIVPIQRLQLFRTEHRQPPFRRTRHPVPAPQSKPSPRSPYH